MEPEEPPAYPLVSSTTFGSTKREILLVLKREGQSDLQSLAEDKKHGSSKFEILEHNCPIIAIAENYWEACTVENEMFRKVLDVNVETTHRVVDGANVCRFLITPKARNNS